MSESASVPCRWLVGGLTGRGRLLGQERVEPQLRRYLIISITYSFSFHVIETKLIERLLIKKGTYYYGFEQWKACDLLSSLAPLWSRILLLCKYPTKIKFYIFFSYLLFLFLLLLPPTLFVPVVVFLQYWKIDSNLESGDNIFNQVIK